MTKEDYKLLNLQGDHLHLAENTRAIHRILKRNTVRRETSQNRMHNLPESFSFKISVILKFSNTVQREEEVEVGCSSRKWQQAIKAMFPLSTPPKHTAILGSAYRFIGKLKR
jgi:hypothetical protein